MKFQQEQTATGAKEARAAYTRAWFLLLTIGAIVFAFADFWPSALPEASQNRWDTEHPLLIE